MAVVGASSDRIFQQGFKYVLGVAAVASQYMGVVKPWAGRVFLDGKDVTDVPPHKKVELGMALVPEGRRLFADMTVEENLLMGAYTKRAREKVLDTLEWVYSLFPRLRERRRQKAGTMGKPALYISAESTSCTVASFLATIQHAASFTLAKILFTMKPGTSLFTMTVCLPSLEAYSTIFFTVSSLV